MDKSLTLFCTASRYTRTQCQPLHHLILYPIPALLPGSLVLMVSHCTFSYSMCSCTAARFTSILGQPLHLLILCVPALLPGSLVPSVSHCTFSYSVFLDTPYSYSLDIFLLSDTQQNLSLPYSSQISCRYNPQSNFVPTQVELRSKQPPSKSAIEQTGLGRIRCA